MADGETAIILAPQPFAPVIHHLTQPAGRTVAQMLVEAVSKGLIDIDDLARTALYVDGRRLDRDVALDQVLHEGQVVNVQVEVLGGGGRKNVGQILMTIAVIAVSAWVGAGAGSLIASKMLAQVAAATVLTLGQAASAALFAPDRQAKAAVNDRYALQNASNDYRPWQPFPIALGEVHVAPDMAVKTFTQARGDDVWLYGILGLHYGPCEISELKIGDTLVSSMGSGDVQIVEHLTPGERTFTLYPNDTDQLDLQEELEATTSSATVVTRAGSAEGQRFEFDFYLPGGLHFQKDDGRILAAQVTVTIRYRPIDENGEPTTETWTSGLTVALNSTTTEPWRVTRSLDLPLGRYEFDFRRSVKPDANAKRRDDIALTAIRAIAFRKPIADEVLSIVEFAVRATALNQGTLAPITCRIVPLVETWTGSGWSGTPSASSNPAALTRWLLTGPAPARPLTSDQADVGLRDWSALCDENDWSAHIYLKEAREQAPVLAMLEQAGRAGIFWDGTQIVASPWVEKPAPVQMFTGDNLTDHRWSLLYPEPIHGYRVEFANLDEAGAPDELYVYNDGYGPTDDPENGIQAASLIEALRLEGQHTAERAYRDGRWELARRLHQRRVDTWTTDAEHLVSRYGDRVRLAWSKVDGGQSARVRCRRWSGGLVSGLRLNQAVTFEAGLDYAIDLRFDGQVVTAVPLQNPATSGVVQTREIRFAVARSASACAAGGDLVAFGEPTRISEDVELIGIAPAEGLKATVTGIRYVAPLLMAAETGPIPPLQTRLTRQRDANPPAPSLLGVQIDDLGIRVGFAMPPWRGSPITGFVCRWRPRPEPGEASGWVELPSLGATAMTLVTPPLREFPNAATEVTAVEIEIRAQTASGRMSAPLLVEIEDPSLLAPATGDWVWTVKPAAQDGSSQPALSVRGTVRALKARHVVIEYIQWPPDGEVSEEEPEDDADWIGFYDGPPSTRAVDVTGLDPLKSYFGSVRYLSPQGVSGPRTVWGPYKVGGLIANNSLAWGGRPVTDLFTLMDALLQGMRDLHASVMTEAERRRTFIEDQLTRLGVIGDFDPISKTGFFRTEAITLGEDGQTLLETVDGLLVADADNVGLVLLEQAARVAGDAAEAAARLSAITTLNDQIAFAGLELRNYTDDQITEATAGLATSIYVDDAIGLADLNLRNYFDGEILEATAGLVTSVQLGEQMALAALDAQARVDEYGSYAATNFASFAAFDGLESVVGIHTLAIAGLDAQNSLARLELVAAAAGGNPARLSLVSDDLGADIALDGDRVWFGPYTRFDIASRTFITDIPGTTTRMITHGPFGTDGKLIWWIGPNTVDPDDASTVNGSFFIHATSGTGGGVGVGGPSLPTGGGVPTSNWATWSGTVAGSGWQTVATLTVSLVPAGGQIQVTADTSGSMTSDGSTYSGNIRVIEAVSGVTVAGPEPISIMNLGDGSGVGLIGTASATGTVTYHVQIGGGAGTVTSLVGSVGINVIPV